MSEVNIDNVLDALKARLKETPNPLCVDDKPIHWVARLTQYGWEVRDSAGLMGAAITFRGFPLDLPELDLRGILNYSIGWLDQEIPESKGWSLEVKK